MEKTILLTKSNMRPGFTKWAFVGIGVLNFVNGLIKLSAPEYAVFSWSLMFNIGLVIVGLMFIVLGLIIFDPSNRLAPKISVSESEILIKESLYRNVKKFDWKTIKQITFGSFELSLLTADNQETVVALRTDKQSSVEIKKALREIAQTKQVEVIGG